MCSPYKESRTCPICGEVFSTYEAMQNCIAQHDEDVLWFDRHYGKGQTEENISKVGKL